MNSFLKRPQARAQGAATGSKHLQILDIKGAKNYDSSATAPEWRFSMPLGVCAADQDLVS
jgi:hypothetical protein